MKRRYRFTPSNSDEPEWLLAIRWKKLSTNELARYVRRVIVVERKCIRGEIPKHVGPRLRWRRVAAARRLVVLGHPVDGRVFPGPNVRHWSLGERMLNVPPRYSWIGVFTIVPLQYAGDKA